MKGEKYKPSGEENKMKTSLYAFTTTLILISMLVAGVANSAGLRVASSGSSIKATGGTSIMVPSLAPDKDVPQSNPELSKYDGPDYAEQAPPTFSEYDGPDYVEQAPHTFSKYEGPEYANIIDCGKPEHQDLPIGDRFLVTNNGDIYIDDVPDFGQVVTEAFLCPDMVHTCYKQVIYEYDPNMTIGNGTTFFDRKTCLEWWIPNPQSVQLVDYDYAYWRCGDTAYWDAGDGLLSAEWSLPTYNDLLELIEDGKTGPAVRNDFPVYIDPNASEVWAHAFNEQTAPVVNMYAGGYYLLNRPTSTYMDNWDYAQSWCVR